MIKRKYDIIELSNGEKELTVSFVGENLELLALLFNGELENFSDWIRINIEDVLNRNVQNRHISGNICELNINYEKTRIYNILTDDDLYCEIDTKELYNLINEWVEKNSSLKMRDY